MSRQSANRWAASTKGLCCLLLILSTAGQAGGADDRSDAERRSEPITGRSPTPFEDDAPLHDVQFVGSKIGWAVGDQGVIWHTTDGGHTWQLIPSPVECSLRSLCFLTDRIGWIVGGQTASSTRIGTGVVLFTRDGGRTWEQLAQGTLPRLYSVRFFDLEQGIAVGDPHSDFPTGVMVTQNGGRTWHALPGSKTEGWRAAHFLSPEIGAVAGPRGQVSLVGGGQLLQPRLGEIGPRGIRDVVLNRDESGWLVGDGGLVLHTENGGVVWQGPPRPLPPDLRDLFEFRTVAVHGEKVWIAGAPGSVIWHSPDAGRTWVKQPTGQTVPIHRLAFSSETDGWAVGALGMILRTTDGGNSWNAVRGGMRRAAWMGIGARAARVPFPLIVKQSAELGYRSVTYLPARESADPPGDPTGDLETRLHESVLRAGGSAGELEWRFPLSAPGLERDSEKLVTDWDRRWEGRLQQVFLGRLVCQIRTWRPNVIVVDHPPKDDAVSQLLNDALLHAVQQAADPTRFIAHHELARLEPWKVDRVFVRLPAGSTGQTHLDLHQYLPRVGKSVHMAALPAMHLLVEHPSLNSKREAYRILLDQTEVDEGNRALSDFFTGIPLAPGSEARRSLATMDELQYEAQKKTAERQRNFRAYADRFLNDSRMAAQLIAELRQVTADMPDEQAAWQLAHLAEDYRRHSRWDLVESTLVELVTRFPDEQVSVEAMQWLFHLWSGAEPAWQRARAVQVGRQQLVSNPEDLRSRIQKASYLAQVAPEQRSSLETDLGPDPVKFVQTEGQLKIDDNQNWRRGAVQHWNEQALRMASLIRKRSPELYRRPEIQFPLAAMLRQRGTHRLADEHYRKNVRIGGDDAWSKTAEAELWLLGPLELPPKPFALCRRTDERPYLDGTLSDDCWQRADEIRLHRSDEPESDPQQPYAFVMLSYDSEFLYVAASVPREPGTRDDPPRNTGRTHDADLSEFDRISLYLDIDRNYATYYALHVDQRGWTADACWHDKSWNPKWYVAAEADRNRWRIEAAIPFEELVPMPPTKNHVWSVGIVRTVPAVRVESWTTPIGPDPRPERFGFIRFD